MIASKLPAPSAGPTGGALPELSADDVHRQLVCAFRAGNRERLRFCRLLASLAESRLYLKLGHASIAQYAERHFAVGRSETFEMVRVAAGIDGFPELSAAFLDGRLAWSALKRITRVATADTEHDWLRFARDHTAAELDAEVRHAADEKRDAPRADRFGLPNLRMRFSVELTAEEHERLRAALEQVGGEIAGRLGDHDTLSAKDALLYVVERFLRTEADGTPEDRRERDAPFRAIVYHQCPTCRRARMHGEDGPIEVEAACVERVADAGSTETIDRPNPPALARRVKLRDGERCRNPGCGSRGPLHAHHIVFRSNGGRTVASNEVAVCTTCHALIHAGLLTVEGDPFDALRWRARSQSLGTQSAIADSRPRAGPRPDAARLAVAALGELGLGRAAADAAVERAVAATRSEDPGTLIAHALRAQAE